MVASNDFANSSGHWYRLDGTPAYTIVGKNGKERNTTLRDARELTLVPSVTTIIRCASAPQLEKWKRNQVLLAALTLPRNEGEAEDAWLARVEKDWQESSRNAMDRGTEIHGAIERSYRGQAPDPDWWDWVKAARGVIDGQCGPQNWFPERSFAHPDGFGGKCDLHSASWVIDVKTKDGEAPKGLYDEHLMQLAAYRHGLGVPGARCGILYVSRDTPAASFVEAGADDLRAGLAMFSGLLTYWQAKNSYHPGALHEKAA